MHTRLVRHRCLVIVSCRCSFQIQGGHHSFTLHVDIFSLLMILLPQRSCISNEAPQWLALTCLSPACKSWACPPSTDTLVSLVVSHFRPATAYLPICCMEFRMPEFSLFWNPTSSLISWLYTWYFLFPRMPSCLSISCMSSCYGVSNYSSIPLVGFSDVLRESLPWLPLYITVPVIE